MGKGQSPTADELKFIYNLISQGYSDADIIKKYEELRRHGQLGALNFRQDVRFIRQRRKEFEAAKTIIESHIKKLDSPLIIEAKRKHFDHLAEIAKFLLDGDLDKLLPDSFTEEISDNYTIHADEDEELSKEELAARLDTNFENAIHHYGPTDVLGNFLSHLEAECSEIIPGKWDEVIRNNPYVWLDTVRILSQRKTFKGSCPACPDQ